MIRASKIVLRAVLVPPAAIARMLQSFRRLWSHVRLAAEIAFPLDPTVVILGVPEVHGTGNIQLGANLLIYPDLYLETRGEGFIRIGDNVVISRGVHIVAYANVEIGADSMIGEYSSIRDANHRRSEGIAIRESGHSASSVRIGSNVWLGRGTAILAGVSIGDNATVGANAVVTRDVPAGCISVGVPARSIHAYAERSQ